MTHSIDASHIRVMAVALSYAGRLVNERWRTKGVSCPGLRSGVSPVGASAKFFHFIEKTLMGEEAAMHAAAMPVRMNFVLVCV